MHDNSYISAFKGLGRRGRFGRRGRDLDDIGEFDFDFDDIFERDFEYDDDFGFGRRRFGIGGIGRGIGLGIGRGFGIGGIGGEAN